MLVRCNSAAEAWSSKSPYDMPHGMTPVCSWHTHHLKQHGTLPKLSARARMVLMHAGMLTAHGLLVQRFHGCLCTSLLVHLIACLCNPKTSFVLQNRPLYTGNLHSETPGGSTNVVLHRGNVLAACACHLLPSVCSMSNQMTSYGMSFSSKPALTA